MVVKVPQKNIVFESCNILNNNHFTINCPIIIWFFSSDLVEMMTLVDFIIHETSTLKLMHVLTRLQCFHHRTISYHVFLNYKK